MELIGSTSRRGFSVRSIFTFVLTVLATALLLNTFASPISQAEEINASWKGESIMYDGHQYYRNTPAKPGESHGLTEGTEYYSYIETISERPAKQKAHVIYFPTGTDPPKATSASYVVYDYFTGRVFANPGTTQTIVIEPSGTSDSVETSCAIEGVGWIVCSVSVWLAEGMDWLFGVLASMMAAQPIVTGDSNNDLYIAWNIMRGIANVAFIISFLIIIYSQLTGFGVDNYGIKKLIPRLIIAALLVNLSFYICAVFLDLSNIAGYSLQDIFVQIRENTFNIDEDTWSADVLDWKSVTGFVLSGGTVGFLGVSAATAGSIASAAFLIVPILLGLLLTALFVLIVLAARQAIIVILIVMAPLAFVAYLLPNTEKWFERWRDLFMTMLIFFPAFSLVFGGSQLAGGIILQNATSIVMLIFGLAVQIAPLAITPLLLKLSGGLLGKIAGIVNDPRKGLMDRTRNWAKDRGEMHRQKSLANKSGLPGVRWLNPFRFAAKRMDNGNQNVKKRTEAYSQMNENRFMGSRTSGYRSTHRLTHQAGQDKNRIGNVLDKYTYDLENKAGTRENLGAIRLEQSKTALERSQTANEQMFEDYRSGQRIIPRGVRHRGQLVKLQRSMARNVIETTSLKEAVARAKYIQQIKYAEAIKVDSALSKMAGGVDTVNGAQRAIANATALLSKARKDTLANIEIIIGDVAKNSEQVRILAEGGSIAGIDTTQDVVAAALKMTLGGKDSSQIVKAMENLDFSFSSGAYASYSADERSELQALAGEALEENAAKPPQIGAGFIGNLKQGLDFSGTPYSAPLGQAGMDIVTLESVKAGKLDSGKMQTAGKDYMATVLGAIQRNPRALSPSVKANLKAELAKTLDPNRTASEKLGDSKPILEQIDRLI